MLAAQQNITKYILDDVDRKIISATQSGLPLTLHPYHDVAEQIGLDVKTVITRMQNMTDLGIIRRTGVVPNHYKLGFRSNGMSVWQVPEEKITQLGEKIGSLDFVSHCYQRPQFLPEWPYNLFAMVHGTSHDEVHEKVKNIAELLADDNIAHQVLFSTRILKKTGLRI
ncbi:MAG: protein nirH [endosymbiont of Galathealinum brachiosum]|uniref:siroheme decarboxylase n=1 Tax=endosymbiont of Galathealinum brachiosum TaxID=2200906 RepID=A0A370DLE3_9GAMM|nr:MAG: protein nirH [endosymbiont of Galathealinum brachiosum]